MQRKQKPAATIGYHEAIKFCLAILRQRVGGAPKGKASPHKTIPLPAAIRPA